MVPRRWMKSRSYRFGFFGEHLTFLLEPLSGSDVKTEQIYFHLNSQRLFQRSVHFFPFSSKIIFKCQMCTQDILSFNRQIVMKFVTTMFLGNKSSFYTFNCPVALSSLLWAICMSGPTTGQALWIAKCPHCWAMITQLSAFSLSHTNCMIDIYLSSKSWTYKSSE